MLSQVKELALQYQSIQGVANFLNNHLPEVIKYRWRPVHRSAVRGANVMPSPFPGVDPYIESQHFWPDFHQSFMTYWRDQLLDLLPDNYDARLEERVQQVVLSEGREGRSRYPDIAVTQSQPTRRQSKSQGGAALLLEPITIALPEYEDLRESYIQVTHRPDRTLVAVLELLSPTNKEGSGFSAYLLKRQELYFQNVHLVEVDLLIDGRRLPMRKKLPPAHHYAIISRGDRRPKADVFAWTLRDRLPALPIPLRPPDPDIVLDLGQVFATAYERGRYGRILDYSNDLELPLSLADLRWAKKFTKSKKN
jgi:hypothetical protein